MTDDFTAPASDPAPSAATDPTAETTATDPQPTGPSAGEAWGDVVAAMNGLGDAVSNWARAATNDPDAKQKLAQVRVGISEIARKADVAVSQVSSSEFGQQVKGGAEQAGQAIGDAAQQVTTAAAPHVKTAFAGLASAFGRAAERMDEAAARRTPPAEAAAPPAPAPATAADPDATAAADPRPAPPAPAPAPPIPGDE